MSTLDWLVLWTTILFIIGYGTWKGKNTKNIDGFLLADRKMPWFHVGLSVMATQASAITFLSAPGLAYQKGMGFVQFYFGLPLAVLLVCHTFIPNFSKLNVYTAYEYLEKRFDSKTRFLVTLLFLIQRSLSTGISIFAPSIILSSILNIDIVFTTVIMGVLVIVYTVWGGAKTVSYTQMLQMFVVFGGMFVAGVMTVKLLPQHMNFWDAWEFGSRMGKTDFIDFRFNPKSEYNVWSGLIGGFFLQLSYFGTDQSQVGRYLTGKNIQESRLGLIMNGIIKIPMQFMILMLGVLVFSFYQFNKTPLYFNEVALNDVKASKKGNEILQIERNFNAINDQKIKLLNSSDKIDFEKLNQLNDESIAEKEKALTIIKANNPNADDKNYIFLSFILNYLPHGLIGLLVAIIILAAMGSLASGLNSLGSVTMVDLYKGYFRLNNSPEKELFLARAFTVAWGLVCILFAFVAGRFGNLLEAVNILGSWFYGTILGVFLVAFYCKYLKADQVFYAAILAEISIALIDFYTDYVYLWFSMFGCVLVVLFSHLLYFFHINRRAIVDILGLKK
ncbi:MAG: sodium:solute symporter [Pseudarcicella sp.]|nr:sodium:solute symporter [Pseudarcicella sp.]